MTGNNQSPDYGTPDPDWRSDLFSVLLEPISKSSEEEDKASKLHETEEVVGVILPADEDAALPLYPSKEPLDEPASRVAAYPCRSAILLWTCIPVESNHSGHLNFKSRMDVW